MQSKNQEQESDLHGNLPLPAVVLSLVVDVIRVQNHIAYSCHQRVHNSSSVIGLCDIVERFHEVEEHNVDSLENDRRLCCEQRGEGKCEQLPPLWCCHTGHLVTPHIKNLSMTIMCQNFFPGISL